jgi:hypothetical protein
MPCGSEDLTGQTAMVISGCSTVMKILTFSMTFRASQGRFRDHPSGDGSHPTIQVGGEHPLTDLRSAGADPTGRSETMN